MHEYEPEKSMTWNLEGLPNSLFTVYRSCNRKRKHLSPCPVGEKVTRNVPHCSCFLPNSLSRMLSWRCSAYVITKYHVLLWFILDKSFKKEEAAHWKQLKFALNQSFSLTVDGMVMCNVTGVSQWDSHTNCSPPSAFQGLSAHCFGFVVCSFAVLVRLVLAPVSSSWSVSRKAAPG